MRERQPQPVIERLALDVTCPHCGAIRNQACIAPSGRKSPIHEGRRRRGYRLLSAIRRRKGISW